MPFAFNRCELIAHPLAQDALEKPRELLSSATIQHLRSHNGTIFCKNREKIRQCDTETITQNTDPRGCESARLKTYTKLAGGKSGFLGRFWTIQAIFPLIHNSWHGAAVKWDGKIKFFGPVFGRFKRAETANRRRPERSFLAARKSVF